MESHCVWTQCREVWCSVELPLNQRLFPHTYPAPVNVFSASQIGIEGSKHNSGTEQAPSRFLLPGERACERVCVCVWRGGEKEKYFVPCKKHHANGRHLVSAQWVTVELFYTLMHLFYVQLSHFSLFFIIYQGGQGSHLRSLFHYLSALTKLGSLCQWLFSWVIRYLEKNIGDRVGTEGLVGQTACLQAAVPRGTASRGNRSYFHQGCLGWCHPGRVQREHSLTWVCTESFFPPCRF